MCPAVAFELHSINLLTMERQPAPAGHWQAALAAANLTEQQRTQMAIANLFCQPRLRQLQQEQQALMQQLTELHESSSGAVQDSMQEATAAAAAAGQPGPGSPLLSRMLDGTEDSKAGVPVGVTVMLASKRLQASLAPSVKTEAEGAVDASGPPGGGWGGAAAAGRSGSSGSLDAPGSSAPASDSSNHARQRQMDRANELTQQMAANCRTWRVVTSMRGQYSAALMTPLQFARVLAAAAPYLLIGAPM